MSKKKAVVIGGGHNGLVCAFYLARAGFAVSVLERRHVLGGAAVTEEFHPGFRNSTASYTVSLLAPQIIADMQLHERGLRILERPISNFLPLTPTQYLKLGGGLQRTQAEIAKFSAHDAAALPAYHERLDAIADLLRQLSAQTAPDLLQPRRSLPRAWAQARRLNALTATQKRDLLALFTQSAADFLDGFFEHDLVKGAFAFDAVVGHFASPHTPGSAYVLLHHCFGGVNGKKGIWGHAVGGMGAITQAMARACEAEGVALHTQAPVARVDLAQGRASGVTTEDGRHFPADVVAANLHPQLLFTRLVDGAALPADFLQRMQRYRSHSGTLRMNVALSELPNFRCLPHQGQQAGEHHASGIIMAPGLGYLDRAHDDARRLGWSREPIVEMLIPSTVDPTLAPPGRHVASLFCQQFAFDLPGGRSWDDCRDAAADLVIDTVNRHAPNFKASVLGRLVLAPPDLQQRFGLVGGDIFHGVMSLDQLWAARPVLGHGDHRSPVPGLYLCGSGTHPGGGVSGLPGYNAAREVRRDHSAWAALKLALAGA